MRTTLLFILLCICYISSAQNIKASYDKFTGDSTFTGEVIVPNTALIISTFKKGGNKIYVSFVCLKTSCIDDNAKVYFVFNDGTRANGISADKFNCEGSFVLPLDVSSELLNLFKEKKVKSIRLTTRSGFVDFDLTAKQADLFYKNYAYLYNKWYW